MITTGPVTLELPTGKVSGEFMLPGDARCILTLAHGAGAGMHHPFMVKLATALAELDIATLRFNFSFIEEKKKRPDVPAVAHKAVEVAIAQAKDAFPDLPLYVSGKSFGGRMSSQFLATHHDNNVKGIIFFGFPLHPAGKPAIDRADHLKKVKVPMLFLQGTRDELATWSLIEEVCASLQNATLVKIEGADHAFKAGKTDVISLLAKSVSNWIK